MTARARLAAWSALAVAGALGIWLLFFALPRMYAPRVAGSSPAAQTSPEGVRRIRARLFYVSEDGRRLVPLEQEVPYADGTAEQAKRIVEAQLAAPAPPLVSAVPYGTRLRALYVTAKGEAFVDLSREVADAHPGGSLNELFTVYSIVDALAENLPAITSVQILVDGRETDTLAGHVDLRRPLAKDLRWVDQGTAPGAAQ